PHHIVQETIRFYVDPNPVAHAIDCQMRDGADARHTVGPIGLEAMEVMPAFKRESGLAHGRSIQTILAVMAEAAQEEIRHGAVVNHITIQLPFGVVVGIESLRHVLGCTDNDIGRQMSVDSLDQSLGGMPRRAVKVDYLTDRMDSGVRPATG